MKITYTLTQDDIEFIIAKYMKEKYNFDTPFVEIKKELKENYYDGNKTEAIVAYVSDLN
jgi:hypothetical protein